ncbi:mCG147703 [Mus musculus]|nr:mCG147703 [Mus musculus]
MNFSSSSSSSSSSSPSPAAAARFCVGKVLPNATGDRRSSAIGPGIIAWKSSSSQRILNLLRIKIVILIAYFRLIHHL